MSREARVTATEYRETMSEADLLWTIVEAAIATGYWLVYHTHDSRRSQAGFPDVMLVGHPAGPFAGRMYALELKTKTGRTTAEQERWLRGFQLLATLVDARDVGGAVVRPALLDDVLALIQTGRPNGRLAEGLVATGNGSESSGSK
jgi:hypothetical protein